MLKRFLLISIALCFGASASADIQWPHGKRAAVALTYDDAVPSQLAHAVPQLDAAGLRGTFYLDLDGPLTIDEIKAWRAAAARGHELGNHTIFHPCSRTQLKDRDPHYTTESYTVENLLREIGAMNNVLFAIDGKTSRTYAVTCSLATVNGVDYTEPLRAAGLVKYVRTGGGPEDSIVTDVSKLDLFRVPSWGPVGDPSDAARVMDYVRRIRDSKGFGVVLFHGIGGDYLEISADAHRELLAYLKAHPEIWVTTFHDLLDHVAKQKPPKR